MIRRVRVSEPVSNLDANGGGEEGEKKHKKTREEERRPSFLFFFLACFLFYLLFPINVRTNASDQLKPCVSSKSIKCVDQQHRIDKLDT